MGWAAISPYHIVVFYTSITERNGILNVSWFNPKKLGQFPRNCKLHRTQALFLEESSVSSKIYIFCQIACTIFILGEIFLRDLFFPCLMYSLNAFWCNVPRDARANISHRELFDYHFATDEKSPERATELRL